MNTQTCLFLSVPCQIEGNNLVIQSNKDDLLHSVGTFIANASSVVVGDALSQFIVNKLTNQEVVKPFQHEAKTDFVLYRVDGNLSKNLSDVYVTKLIPTGANLKTGVLQSGSFSIDLGNQKKPISDYLKTINQLLENKPVS